MFILLDLSDVIILIYSGPVLLEILIVDLNTIYELPKVKNCGTFRQQTLLQVPVLQYSLKHQIYKSEE